MTGMTLYSGNQQSPRDRVKKTKMLTVRRQPGRHGGRLLNMVVSQNMGSQYRPQNTIVLILGPPNKVPLILGNPHIDLKGIEKSTSSEASLTKLCALKAYGAEPPDSTPRIA